MAITAVPTNHYRGGSNLNRGSKTAPGAVSLEEKINEMITEENRLTVLSAKTRLQVGAAASVLLTQGGQPSNTDTLDVGSDTYQFLTTPAGATSDIEVEIGGTAEATLDNLIAAAQTYGTENLKWTKVSATVISIKTAATPNGTVAGADPSIALDASSATNYSFDVGDVNMNTLAGKAASVQDSGETQLTITTAMISSGAVRIDFPFTPTNFIVTLMTAAGALKMAATDTFVINGNGIVITLNGGGGDLANTDVVRIVAFA